MTKATRLLANGKVEEKGLCRGAGAGFTCAGSPRVRVCGGLFGPLWHTHAYWTWGLKATRIRGGIDVGRVLSRKGLIVLLLQRNGSNVISKQL